MGPGTVRSVITLYSLNEDLPTLVCLSRNLLGFDSLAYNVSSSETQLGGTLQKPAFIDVLSVIQHALLWVFSGVDIVSLLIGSAAGALGMMVICIPLLIFFCRYFLN